MRTVTGPSDRVVVVGAGLGGLSCALYLAAAGRQVTVVEREPVPGGRAGRLSVDGYEFDTGPTVLTMPELIAEPLAAVGEKLSDWLELTPLEPAYRAFYPDGSGGLTSPAALAHLAEVIADTGAVAQVESLIEQRVTDGISALAEAPIHDEARAALTSLAAQATHRRA